MAWFSWSETFLLRRRFVVSTPTVAIDESISKVENFGSDQMVEIGSGAQRPLKTVMMSRYACYLVIRNADPAKDIVAQGPNLFRHHAAGRSR
jgi:DNA-damage-inducible protein D